MSNHSRGITADYVESFLYKSFPDPNQILKEEVKALARVILPFSRHREKMRRICLVLDEKNEDWAIMAPKVEAIQHEVKDETVKTINRAEIEYIARHPEPHSGVVG